MNKILAIDDQEDNLVVYEAILSNYFPDFKLLKARSGKEGIEKALEELPDVILLDIIMPEMDGYETCRNIKSIEEIRHIPIVLITAVKTDSSSRIKGLDIGADSFLAKPIDPGEFA
ncbi:MAG: response regulator, partial [Bacteroidetes bacterium]|nr:response regulator [Bacteroidota bacterium]